MIQRQPYQVFFTKTGLKDYESIKDQKLKRGIDRMIEKIKADPFQYKSLSGQLSDLRTAKTFSFRLLYYIENNTLYITIVAIKHRKDIYRQ